MAEENISSLKQRKVSKAEINQNSYQNKERLDKKTIDNIKSNESDGGSSSQRKSVKISKVRKKDNQKKLYEEIEIPKEISVEIRENFLIIRKNDKELKRKLNDLINFKIEVNKIIISSERDRRIEKRLFGTFSAHIKNMINGLIKGFIYKLQIANVHFPMNVIYNKENNEIIVKNFLGENKDRIIKSVPEVEIKIDKDIVELKSFDIEKAGQIATNIEKGTKIRNKDRRIYQDGIFIIEKPGRVYL
ncbi:MAG: 50S ribosomal protein L6 [Nanoarchaeota archaeon]